MDGGRYQAVQYAGEAIRALSMQERMTLSNMTAELGGQTGLIESDETTANFLRHAGAQVDDSTVWRGDSDARLAEHRMFDAGTLEPQVAAPHSPENSAPVGDYPGVRVDVAYIGACTGAKLEDLRMAANVLRGRKIAKTIDLMVAPASLRDQEIARSEGTLAALLDAGARLLPNACGICAGYGDARFGEGVTAISSTARNFKGRMGAASSNVYLGSPYTVAASAIEGRIADPRQHLREA
jgi:3-isopropylmalate/(R)-2-methylmalate dehydratase large subunit